MVGIAAAQMTSFSTHYRHLGRAFGGWVSRRRRTRGARSRRRAMFGAPVYVIVLLIGVTVVGVRGAAAFILVANLAYGFLPTVLAQSRAVSLQRRMKREEAAPAGDVDVPPEAMEVVPPEAGPAG
jgi:Flp pilus assembly protein TadB